MVGDVTLEEAGGVLEQKDGRAVVRTTVCSIIIIINDNIDIIIVKRNTASLL